MKLFTDYLHASAAAVEGEQRGSATVSATTTEETTRLHGLEQGKGYMSAMDEEIKKQAAVSGVNRSFLDSASTTFVGGGKERRNEGQDIFLNGTAYHKDEV